MKILSAEQIRQWDKFTIQHMPISSLQLMERAAEACTSWIEKIISDQPIKIFCGKGNNGGDGLAIARQLAEKGVIAEVYILENGSEGSEDFEANIKRLQKTSVEISYLQSANTFPIILSRQIVIDALFGSGLNRPLEGLASQLVNYINTCGPTVISIDVPSGMFCDSSSLGNSIIKATHTLTFQTLKLAFLFPENEQHVGNVHILDIGLMPQFLSNIDSSNMLVDEALIKKIYRPRNKFAHKGTYGHTLIIAGEKGKMGASILCTKGCLRSGAGLVSVMVPEKEFAIIQTGSPEAMAIRQEEFQYIELDKHSCIGIGPGIGITDHAISLVKMVLHNYTKPVVFDADAINILSHHQELMKLLPKESIFTPHPKEFERLFGETNNTFERLELAKQHAQTHNTFIIIKGHYSSLICPDGNVFFNSTGNPGMATGGSGDVLTGMIAGLLSQGYSSRDAAILGMYIHGLAGDIAASKFSEEAMLAGDIIECIGLAYKDISNRLVI